MRATSRRLFLVCAAAAVAAGIAAAVSRAWLCDDAFISFRYADNLVRGHGLVFNAGERVEGDTNFLWTLWIAAGMKLGVAAEAWASVWGIACFAATLALLAWRGWRIAAEAGLAWPIPVAALLGAAHVEWSVFATSGLETSAFTLLAFAGYLVVSDGRRRAAGGALLALASLTRPDGVIFAAVCGLWILARRDLRGAVAFSFGFLVLWGPATAWRIWYYGDFFPNTYYAKSAWLPWWSQGLFYAKLYFTRYWPLLLAVPLAAVGKTVERAGATGGPRAGFAGRGGGAAGDARSIDSAALELALALAYAAYVLRIGGDFMFGRLLVPITPYLLLLLERGLGALRPALRAGAAAALAAAILFTPAVVDGRIPGVRGIVDERATYSDFLEDWPGQSDGAGAALAKLFDGLPVSVCFFGAEARVIYRSRVRTAIECETGLTDATIAHQPLRARGRIGHEKTAPLWYLLRRRVHLVLNAPWARHELELDRWLPDVPVNLAGVRGRLITWDPELMAALAARGARFPDVPAQIDRYLAALSGIPDAQVQVDYDRLRRFYFDQVHDPAREAPFRARLGLP